VRKATQEVFIAQDGKVFLPEEECQEHEYNVKFENMVSFVTPLLDEYNWDDAEEIVAFIILNIEELNRVLGM
jgi:hypothetical protein